MQTVVTDVRGLYLSVCPSVCLSRAAQLGFTVWGHSVQPLPNDFGLLSNERQNVARKISAMYCRNAIHTEEALYAVLQQLLGLFIHIECYYPSLFNFIFLKLSFSTNPPFYPFWQTDFIDFFGGGIPQWYRT